ncbi:MAG: S-layer homology domain-containing protein, partial [Actinomycetota bacterium]
TKGRTATSYGPRGAVTRDQMASFVARTIELANSLELTPPLTDLPPYDGTPDFDDVTPSNPHYSNIMRISQAGITQGRSPRRFNPGGTVTREEMAAFVNRTAAFLLGTKYTTNDDYFTDDETSFAEADINGIASRGIAVGDGADTYGPRALVARDQMASFLIRFLARLHADERIKPLPTSSPDAPDGNINGNGGEEQAANTNEGVDVRLTSKAGNSFDGCEITAVAAAPAQDTTDQSKCFRYVAKAADTFVVDGDDSDLEGFLAELSPRDDVTGVYSKSGESTFSLKNEAPLPPEGVTGTAEANTIALQIDDSATTTVDAYNVYRSDASPLPGLACQEQALSYEKIGTVADPSPTTDSGNATFDDANLEPSASYCYKVHSVDDGDESAASVASGEITTTAGSATVAGRPKSQTAFFVDGSTGTTDELDAGDTITLIFNEAMKAPDSGDAIVVRPPGSQTSTTIGCGFPNQCSLSSDGRTITIDVNNPSVNVATNAVIIEQGGYSDAQSTPEFWDLPASPDTTLDEGVQGPISTSATVTNNPNTLGSSLDSGDVITLTFDRAMAAPGTGDRISIDENSNLVCGTNVTCAQPDGQPTVITLTLDGPPFPAPVTLDQNGAEITDQSGFTDTSGVDWDLQRSTDTTLERPAG